MLNVLYKSVRILNIGSILLWIYDFIQYFYSNSLLFNNEIFSGDGNSFNITFLLFAVTAVLFFVFIKRKAVLFTLGLFSAFVLALLGDSLAFYVLPIHNEQFIMFEAILIYYSLLSLLIILLTLLAEAFKKHKRISNRKAA